MNQHTAIARRTQSGLPSIDIDLPPSLKSNIQLTQATSLAVCAGLMRKTRLRHREHVFEDGGDPVLSTHAVT